MKEQNQVMNDTNVKPLGRLVTEIELFYQRRMFGRNFVNWSLQKKPRLFMRATEPEPE